MAVHDGLPAEALRVPHRGKQGGTGKPQGIRDPLGGGGLHGEPLAQAAEADASAVRSRHIGAEAPGIQLLPQPGTGLGRLIVCARFGTGQGSVQAVQVLGTDLPQAHGAQDGKHPVQALTVMDLGQVLEPHLVFPLQHIFRVGRKGLPPVRHQSLPAFLFKQGGLLLRLLVRPLFAPALRHLPSGGIGGQLLPCPGVPPPVHPDAVGDYPAFFVFSGL